MKVEIRNAGREAHISGYVNAVERDSRVLPQSMCRTAAGPFVEKVRAGAFAKAIAANPNIRMLFNHDKNREIGRTVDGTLKLTEDAIGLRAEAVITDPEVVSAAKKGELRGWSFGFTQPVDDWEPTSNDGIQRRNLSGFALDEVSILTKIPAYFGTSVEVRSLTDGEECFSELRAIDDAAEVTAQPEFSADYYKKQVELLKLEGEIL